MTVILHDVYVPGNYGSLLAYLPTVEKYLQTTIFQKKVSLCVQCEIFPYTRHFNISEPIKVKRFFLCMCMGSTNFYHVMTN